MNPPGRPPRAGQYKLDMRVVQVLDLVERALLR